MAYFRALASDVGLPGVTKAIFWIDCVDGSKIEPLTLTGSDLERLYYVLENVFIMSWDSLRNVILT